MPVVPKYSKVNIKEYFHKIKNFRGGSQTHINESRLDDKFAVESVNKIQVQDGIWKTRWGTAYYGQTISGVDYIESANPYRNGNTREVFAIASDGKAYKSIDGGTWTEVTGATFTAGYKPFFFQIGGKLLIANGKDDFCYYDGTSLHTYSGVTDPTAPTNAVRNTLSSGVYNNYYRIQWVNDVGFTNPSPSLNITTDKHRDSWTTGDSVGFDLPTPPSGVTGVQILWGEFDGEEHLLAYIPATATTFTDDASLEVNPYVEGADDNTTSAPKFRSMEVSGNRLWATYDPDHLYRVYFSGTGQYITAFSPFYGGGYIDLEKGGVNNPVAVKHYRDGKGTPMITVFCSSPDGRGTIFQIELTTATVGETSFTVPSAYKIVGSIGGDSPFGVVGAGDNVLFPNVKGIYALRNKEQIFNILSSDDLTAPIRNEYEALNMSRIKDFVGYYKPPMAFFSVSVGSENDRTIIFDFERNNWTWAWTIGFRQFMEYTDSSGIIHFLAVPETGGRLIEISENYKGDLGEAFYQSYISPLIPVSENATDYAKVKEVIFELGNFTGTATCEVLGIQKNKQLSSIASRTESSTIGTTGVGDDLVSDFLLSDTNDEPNVFTQRSQHISVNVKNKKLYYIQFKITSNDIDSVYELLSIQADGKLIQSSRSPSSWRGS